MNEKETNEEETEKSLFDGEFWKKIKSPSQIDPLVGFLWLLVVFPWLVWGTEKSKGEKFQLSVSDLFGIIFMVAAFFSYYLYVGQFLGIINLLCVVLAGIACGLILTLISLRASWILVGASFFFFANFALFILRISGIVELPNY